MAFSSSFTSLTLKNANRTGGSTFPNLPITWVDMCVEAVLIPGHVSHTFLRSPASPQQSTFDPIASFVSAVNLHRDCPPTLLKVLADSHPDCEVWLQSYFEEKRGVESMGTLRKITLGGNTVLCVKKERLAPSLPCVSSQSKRMRISAPFVQNLALLLWGITKTGFGAKAIALPRFFVATLFVSLSASRWRNDVVPFDRVIV